MAKSSGNKNEGKSDNDRANKGKLLRSVERGEILVVGTKVKDLIKNAGFMASSELLEALSVKVHDMLMDATQRARENSRATVRPHDL